MQNLKTEGIQNQKTLFYSYLSSMGTLGKVQVTIFPTFQRMNISAVPSTKWNKEWKRTLQDKLEVAEGYVLGKKKHLLLLY